MLDKAPVGWLDLCAEEESLLLVLEAVDLESFAVQPRRVQVRRQAQGCVGP